MDKLFELFDTYNRQARLFPSLLTVLPPLLALMAWFPMLLTENLGSTFLTIGSSCGLLYLLASLARTKGKSVEGRLLKDWGAWPSTILLRHSSDKLDSVTKKRYHKYLSNCVSGLDLPTEEQEQSSPNFADQKYSSAVKWLKEKTRSKEFSLVRRENIEYGFRRNLRGMKPIGVLTCSVALILTALGILQKQPEIYSTFTSQLWQQLIVHLENLPSAIISAFFVNLAAIICWLAFVTDAWVKQAGYQYAYALLASCEMIVENKNLN